MVEKNLKKGENVTVEGATQKVPILVDPKINLKKSKRVQRSAKDGKQKGVEVVVGMKRRGEEMELDEEGKQKKARDDDVVMNQIGNFEAGLSEQLREQK
jgi:hypothetical protein